MIMNEACHGQVMVFFFFFLKNFFSGNFDVKLFLTKKKKKKKGLTISRESIPFLSFPPFPRG